MTSHNDEFLVDDAFVQQMRDKLMTTPKTVSQWSEMLTVRCTAQSRANENCAISIISLLNSGKASRADLDCVLAAFLRYGNISQRKLDIMDSDARRLLKVSMGKLGIILYDKDQELANSEITTLRLAWAIPGAMYAILNQWPAETPLAIDDVLGPMIVRKVPHQLRFLQVGCLRGILSDDDAKSIGTLTKLASNLNRAFDDKLGKLKGADSPVADGAQRALFVPWKPSTSYTKVNSIFAKRSKFPYFLEQCDVDF